MLLSNNRLNKKEASNLPQQELGRTFQLLQHTTLKRRREDYIVALDGGIIETCLGLTFANILLIHLEAHPWPSCHLALGIVSVAWPLCCATYLWFHVLYVQYLMFKKNTFGIMP